MNTVIVFRRTAHVRGELPRFDNSQNVKMRTAAFFSAINFPTMPYSENLYEFAGIINFIDDSIITEPNSPVVFGTGQFMAGRGVSASAQIRGTMRL
jgi:hypothetical protein